jgi:hypothetical protein
MCTSRQPSFNGLFEPPSSLTIFSLPQVVTLSYSGMFLLNSLRAQHEIIHEAFTIPGDAGLKLSFSRFDGYSPYLDGSVRTAVLESSDSEKSGNITVTVDVKGSSLACNASFRLYTLSLILLRQG